MRIARFLLERQSMTRHRVVAALLVLQAGLFAQPPAPPSGHWAGSIEAGPGIGVEIDLAPQADSWRGTITIPSQGVKGAPLADIAVKAPAVEFAMKGAPGDPRFKGQLSQDGKSLSGTFTQGTASVPMSLTWKGEAQFQVPQKSAPVSKGLLGSWEGTLDIKGTMLRLVLTLTNGPDGATGTLVSLDQGNSEMPVSKITEQGTHLNVDVGMISGTFDGEIKNGEIAGTWTQGPMSLPLVFKRRP
jgi:hypothetical protein